MHAIVKKIIKVLLPKKVVLTLKFSYEKLKLLFSGKIRKIVYRNLILYFYIRNGSDIRHLSVGYEIHFKNKIIDILEYEQNLVVANIGAAQGFYSILAAKYLNTVFSFEPDVEIYKDLVDNIKLNSIQNFCRPYNIALGSTDGEMTMYSDGNHGHAPGFSKSYFHTGNKINIIIARFDTFFQKNNVQPDLLIIDVEGYEFQVLRGLGIYRPKHIFLEIHPKMLVDLGSTKNEVLNLLKEYGYVKVWERIRSGEIHAHFELNVILS